MTIDNYAALDTLRLPSHDNSVTSRANVTARPPQFCAEIIDAIRLLIVKALDIVENAFTFRETRCRYQRRDAINRDIAIHLDTAQSAPPAQPERITFNEQGSAHRAQRPRQFNTNLLVRAQSCQRNLTRRIGGYRARRQQRRG